MGQVLDSWSAHKQHSANIFNLKKDGPPGTPLLTCSFTIVHIISIYTGHNALRRLKPRLNILVGVLKAN